MTERVEMLLRKELIHNRDQLRAYINFPRLDDKKLTIVPPKEQPKLPFDDLGKEDPAILAKKEDTKKKPDEKDSIAAMHFKKMKNGMEQLEKMMGTLENDTAQLTSQIET